MDDPVAYVLILSFIGLPLAMLVYFAVEVMELSYRFQSTTLSFPLF